MSPEDDFGKVLAKSLPRKATVFGFGSESIDGIHLDGLKLILKALYGNKSIEEVSLRYLM